MSSTDPIRNVIISLADEFVIRHPEICEKDEGIHCCVEITIEQHGFEKDYKTLHAEKKIL